MVGEQEVIFDPNAALERLATAAPQIETALIEGCGHDLFVVESTEVDRRIVEFLQRP